MLAVIFEVTPTEAGKSAYLARAAELKARLAQYDGCLSIERFQSLADDRKLLSLSFWRDETALSAWRNDLDHCLAQQQGKEKWFDSYRIRVAQVQRDYTQQAREQAPEDARVRLG
ncbi:antibiotic biosynthesis monooxygenase [Marinobacter hydrocarbonoclasticus]|nr:antibiotic biosynthesis monooxygenase [Marinobacter nauticus]